MKFRIVEYSTNEFRIEYRKWYTLWREVTREYGSFYHFYKDIEVAKKDINDFLAIKKLKVEELLAEKIKLKNKKYHYVDSK